MEILRDAVSRDNLLLPLLHCQMTRHDGVTEGGYEMDDHERGLWVVEKCS